MFKPKLKIKFIRRYIKILRYPVKYELIIEVMELLWGEGTNKSSFLNFSNIPYCVFYILYFLMIHFTFLFYIV